MRKESVRIERPREFAVPLSRIRVSPDAIMVASAASLMGYRSASAGLNPYWIAHVTVTTKRLGRFEAEDFPIAVRYVLRSRVEKALRQIPAVRCRRVVSAPAFGTLELTHALRSMGRLACCDGRRTSSKQFRRRNRVGQNCEIHPPMIKKLRVTRPRW